jgi:hypothetical protein
MAHTKKLLEAGSIDDLLKEVRIEQRKFTNDKKEEINYNTLVLEFDNGDTVDLKAVPELKAAIFYASLTK